MTPKEALSHPWILEGLPETLQEEHLQQLKQPFFVSKKPAKAKEKKISKTRSKLIMVTKGRPFQAQGSQGAQKMTKKYS